MALALAELTRSNARLSSRSQVLSSFLRHAAGASLDEAKALLLGEATVLDDKLLRAFGHSPAAPGPSPHPSRDIAPDLLGGADNECVATAMSLFAALSSVIQREVSEAAAAAAADADGWRRQYEACDKERVHLLKSLQSSSQATSESRALTFYDGSLGSPDAGTSDDAALIKLGIKPLPTDPSPALPLSIVPASTAAALSQPARRELAAVRGQRDFLGAELEEVKKVLNRRAAEVASRECDMSSLDSQLTEALRQRDKYERRGEAKRARKGGELRPERGGRSCEAELDPGLAPGLASAKKELCPELGSLVRSRAGSRARSWAREREGRGAAS
jgi:hypothetical protein